MREDIRIIAIEPKAFLVFIAEMIGSVDRGADEANEIVSRVAEMDEGW